MLDSLRRDALVSFLLERSSLTEAQFDTIILSASERKLKAKAAMRDGREVSEGAFIRTLRQGQKNIESSLYTMILLNYIGLVGNGDLERLLGISAFFSRVKESSPEPEAIERLLETLEEVAESFSRRRTNRKKAYSVT